MFTSKVNDLGKYDDTLCAPEQGISAPTLPNPPEQTMSMCHTDVTSCVASCKFAATAVGSALHFTQACPIMISHLSGIPGQALSTQSLIVIT